MRTHTIGSRVDGLLDELWDAGGTDLLLTPGLPPQIRVHGDLRPVAGTAPLTAEDTEALVAEVLDPDRIGSDDPRADHDFSFGWRDLARIRGNAFRTQDQRALALRMIPRTVPSMEQLGLPPVLGTLAAQHQGLILVTGPTGSGKSTTLAAVVDRINATRACHILTIEDPIEYVHDHKRSAVNQREVGSDTPSFPDALRSALREDPDVVLVGEMRDLESIRFALTIAETGHLVLATLHTNDTAQSLSRMIDVFPGEQQDQVRVQLAAALSAVVYQRLLPRSGGGLIAAHEVLVATPAVRNLVKEGKTHQLRNVLVTGQRDGMVSFEQSLSALVGLGLVEYEDAVARSLYPKEIAPPRVAPGDLGSVA
jgi:twitching motility protein PilT